MALPRSGNFDPEEARRVCRSIAGGRISVAPVRPRITSVTRKHRSEEPTRPTPPPGQFGHLNSTTVHLLFVKLR